MGLTNITAPLIWISDPKMLKEFFVTKGHLFEKHHVDLVTYFGEENILAAKNNERWKRHFKICSPAFSPRILQAVCKVAVESCDSLFKLWNCNLLEKGSSFVLNINDFSNLTLNVLGHSGFNIDFGIYSNNVRGEKFRHCMEKILSTQAIILLMIFEKNSFMYKFFCKVLGIEYATEYCSKYLDEIIEERRKLLENEHHNEQANDIFSLLVDANLKEESISNNELKSNALMLSVAGHETTATTIAWTCYHLSKSAELQRKLWEEVDTVLSGRNPTLEDVQSLPFINALIMESLRLHSPVNNLTRIPIKDVSLGKFEIPKGSHVHAMISYVQRRNDLWENAKEFKPERFLDQKMKDTCQQDFTFAAFSFGNRVCLGKQFSLVEACMILSKLGQEYEFKLLNDESIDPVRSTQLPIVKPTSNLKIRVSKRLEKTNNY